MRRDWDDYFLDLCDVISTRSTCNRLNVGAVIVNEDKAIISTGYNGSLRKMDHCDDGDPASWTCPACKGVEFIGHEAMTTQEHVAASRLPWPVCTECGSILIYNRPSDHDYEGTHCVATVHAEMNAIAQAARQGTSTRGATMYCSHCPCWNCFKVISAAGIKEVVYARSYRTSERVTRTAADERCETKIRGPIRD